MNIPIWDAYALRYAKVKRRRIENFISHDLHDVATQMDYFVWFLKNDQETILVDTGFNEAAAQLRNREYLRCPIESIKNTGVQLEDLGMLLDPSLIFSHSKPTLNYISC